MAGPEQDAIRAVKGSTVSSPAAGQLTVLRWSVHFPAELAPAFQHLPWCIWRRPGGSLPGTFAANGLSARSRHLTIRSPLIRHSDTSASHWRNTLSKEKHHALHTATAHARTDSR